MIKTSNASLLAPLVIALVAVACGGPSKSDTPAAEPTAEAVGVDGEGTGTGALADVSLPEIPSSPAAAPASLMAEVSLSNPNSQITQVATFIDAVQPGMGAFVTPQTLMQMIEGMLGATGLGGIDLNAPMYVTILDGERFVLIATLSSEADLMSSLSGGSTQAVIHNGFAAIGKTDHLASVAPYALSNLVTQPTTEQPTLALHIGKIMGGSHGEQVRNDIRQNLGSQGPGPAGAEMLIEALNNISVLRTSLEASPSGATIHLVADVLPGLLKDFIGKQQPSDFSVVERIGTGPWGLLVGGRLDMSFLGPVLVKLGEAQADPILTQIAAQLASLSGEMAMAMKMPKSPEMVMAMALSDSQGLSQVLATMIGMASKQKDLEMSGMPVQLKADSLKTRGGSLHELKLNPVSPEHKELYGKKGVSAYFGVATGSLIATFGSNAKKFAKVLVTASGKIPGKGTKLDAALGRAKTAGESLFVGLDVQSLQGKRAPQDIEPLVMAIGFSDTTITGRLTVPSDLVKEAAAGGF